MQLTKATLVAVMASLASAQTGTIAGDLAAIPACALTCLASAIGSSGCSALDYYCQCTTGQAAILASASPCILTGCSTADATKAQAVTDDLCKVALAAGPSTGGSSSAAGGASSASSAASSVGSAITSAASSASSAASRTSSASGSVSSAASSAASRVSSAASSAASGASSAASGASSAAAGASGASSSAKPASTTAPNAGAQVTAAAGVIGAAVLAAMAL